MRSFEEIKADVERAISINDADALMNLATELNAVQTPQAEAWASRSKGWALFCRGDYPAALSHNNRAMELYEELDDRSGVAAVTCDIGSVYGNTGDYPAALSHFHRALALHEELGDRKNEATVTNNIGLVHMSTGDYPAALSHYHRALAVHEEFGNLSGIANATVNIGIVYASTGDYPAALSHFHRALALHDELGNRSNVARTTGNIGMVHSRTGDYPDALEYAHRALALHEELGDRASMANDTVNIVAAHVSMGSDAEAQQLLATMDSMHIDEPRVPIEREQLRATLQERSGDLDGAAETLRQALKQALEHGLRALAASTHKALRDLAQKRNDLVGYIEHNNEFTRITEEINGKDATQRMAMMEAERNVEAELRERDKERALLYGALPEHIATRMLRGETVEDHFENAAVLFTDIVGFTTHSSSMHPSDTIKLLDEIFNEFDALCEQHEVTKVKTIGDSYLCFAGSDIGDQISDIGPEERIAAVALAMQNAKFYWPTSYEQRATSHEQRATSYEPRATSNRVQLRIGIHSGPLSAGVIGTQRLQYDVWGDTVNTASRMESTGEPGKIQCSDVFVGSCSLRSQDDAALRHPERSEGTLFTFTPRGEVSVKGKGTMTTYWLEGA